MARCPLARARAARTGPSALGAAVAVARCSSILVSLPRAPAAVGARATVRAGLRCRGWPSRRSPWRCCGAPALELERVRAWRERASPGSWTRPPAWPWLDVGDRSRRRGSTVAALDAMRRESLLDAERVRPHDLYALGTEHRAGRCASRALDDLPGVVDASLSDARRGAVEATARRTSTTRALAAIVLRRRRRRQRRHASTRRWWRRRRRRGRAGAHRRASARSMRRRRRRARRRASCRRAPRSAAEGAGQRARAHRARAGRGPGAAAGDGAATRLAGMPRIVALDAASGPRRCTTLSFDAGEEPGSAELRLRARAGTRRTTSAIERRPDARILRRSPMSPRRVLYLEGEPRWEFKFVRRALDRRAPRASRS